MDMEGGVAAEELPEIWHHSPCSDRKGGGREGPPGPPLAPRLVWATETFGMESGCLRALEAAAHISLWGQGRPKNRQSSGGPTQLGRKDEECRCSPPWGRKERDPKAFAYEGEHLK